MRGNGCEFDRALETCSSEVAGWRLRAARLVGELIACETEEELSAFLEREGGKITPLGRSDLGTWRRILENVYVAICEPTERRSELLRAALLAMGGEIPEPGYEPSSEVPRNERATVARMTPEPSLVGGSMVVPVGGHERSGLSSSRHQASPWARSPQPASSSPAPGAPMPRSLPERDESLGDTSELEPALFAHLAPIPFGAPPSERSVALGETELEPAFPKLIEDDATGDFAGETSILDPDSIADAVAGYPLPIKLPMAVEHYAALVARTEEADEAELTALHRECGIADEAHRKRIDQEFSEALSRDVALRQQFADHLRQGRDWLRRQRGRS